MSTVKELLARKKDEWSAALSEEQTARRAVFRAASAARNAACIANARHFISQVAIIVCPHRGDEAAPQQQHSSSPAMTVLGGSSPSRSEAARGFVAGHFEQLREAMQRPDGAFIEGTKDIGLLKSYDDARRTLAQRQEAFIVFRDAVLVRLGRRGGESPQTTAPQPPLPAGDGVAFSVPPSLPPQEAASLLNDDLSDLDSTSQQLLVEPGVFECDITNADGTNPMKESCDACGRLLHYGAFHGEGLPRARCLECGRLGGHGCVCWPCHVSTFGVASAVLRRKYSHQGVMRKEASSSKSSSPPSGEDEAVVTAALLEAICRCNFHVPHAMVAAAALCGSTAEATTTKGNAPPPAPSRLLATSRCIRELLGDGAVPDLLLTMPSSSSTKEETDGDSSRDVRPAASAAGTTTLNATVAVEFSLPSSVRMATNPLVAETQQQPSTRPAPSARVRVPRRPLNSLRYILASCFLEAYPSRPCFGFLSVAAAAESKCDAERPLDLRWVRYCDVVDAATRLGEALIREGAAAGVTPQRFGSLGIWMRSGAAFYASSFTAFFQQRCALLVDESWSARESMMAFVGSVARVSQIGRGDAASPEGTHQDDLHTKTEGPPVPRMVEVIVDQTTRRKLCASLGTIWSNPTDPGGATGEAVQEKGQSAAVTRDDQHAAGGSGNVATRLEAMAVAQRMALVATTWCFFEVEMPLQMSSGDTAAVAAAPAGGAGGDEIDDTGSSDVDRAFWRRGVIDRVADDDGGRQGRRPPPSVQRSISVPRSQRASANPKSVADRDSSPAEDSATLTLIFVKINEPWLSPPPPLDTSSSSVPPVLSTQVDTSSSFASLLQALSSRCGDLTSADALVKPVISSSNYDSDSREPHDGWDAIPPIPPLLRAFLNEDRQRDQSELPIMVCFSSGTTAAVANGTAGAEATSSGTIDNDDGTQLIPHPPHYQHLTIPKGIIVRSGTFLYDINLPNFSHPNVTLSWYSSAWMTDALLVYRSLLNGGRTAFVPHIAAHRADPFQRCAALVRPSGTLLMVPMMVDLLKEQYQDVFNQTTAFLHDRVVRAAEQSRRPEDTDCAHQHANNERTAVETLKSIARTRILGHSHATAHRYIRDTVLGGRVERIAVGGARPTQEQLDFVKCIVGAYSVTYGSTEGGGIGMTEDDELPGLAASGSMRINSGVVLKLVDVPDMGFTAADEPFPRGEICIRRAGMAAASDWVIDTNDDMSVPRAAAAASNRNADDDDAIRTMAKDTKYTKDGFLRTGDIGELHLDGTIRVIDRVAALVKLPCGKFFSPEQLEERIGGPIDSALGWQRCMISLAPSGTVVAVVESVVACPRPVGGPSSSGAGELASSSGDQATLLLRKLRSRCAAAGVPPEEWPEAVVVDVLPAGCRHWGDVGCYTASGKMSRGKVKQRVAHLLSSTAQPLTEESGRTHSVGWLATDTVARLFTLMSAARHPDIPSPPWMLRHRADGNEREARDQDDVDGAAAVFDGQTMAAVVAACVELSNRWWETTLARPAPSSLLVETPPSSGGPHGRAEAGRCPSPPPWVTVPMSSLGLESMSFVKLRGVVMRDCRLGSTTMNGGDDRQRHVTVDVGMSLGAVAFQLLSLTWRCRWSRRGDEGAAAAASLTPKPLTTEGEPLAAAALSAASPTPALASAATTPPPAAESGSDEAPQLLAPSSKAFAALEQASRLVMRSAVQFFAPRHAAVGINTVRAPRRFGLLVTGATGYVGRHVIADLLMRDTGDVENGDCRGVTCLIRAPSHGEALRRLLSAVAAVHGGCQEASFRPIWNRSQGASPLLPAGAFVQHVTSGRVVRCMAIRDLSASNFGLTLPEYASLYSFHIPQKGAATTTQPNSESQSRGLGPTTTQPHAAANLTDTCDYGEDVIPVRGVIHVAATVKTYATFDEGVLPLFPPNVVSTMNVLLFCLGAVITDAARTQEDVTAGDDDDNASTFVQRSQSFDDALAAVGLPKTLVADHCASLRRVLQSDARDHMTPTTVSVPAICSPWPLAMHFVSTGSCAPADDGRVHDLADVIGSREPSSMPDVALAHRDAKTTHRPPHAARPSIAGLEKRQWHVPPLWLQDHPGIARALGAYGATKYLAEALVRTVARELLQKHDDDDRLDDDDGAASTGAMNAASSRPFAQISRLPLITPAASPELQGVAAWRATCNADDWLWRYLHTVNQLGIYAAPFSDCGHDQPVPFAPANSIAQHIVDSAWSLTVPPRTPLPPSVPPLGDSGGSVASTSTTTTTVLPAPSMYSLDQYFDFDLELRGGDSTEGRAATGPREGKHYPLRARYAPWGSRVNVEHRFTVGGLVLGISQERSGSGLPRDVATLRPVPPSLFGFVARSAEAVPIPRFTPLLGSLRKQAVANGEEGLDDRASQRPSLDEGLVALLHEPVMRCLSRMM